MTPLVRKYASVLADAGTDPVDVHWFDVSNSYGAQERTALEWLKEYKPPFDRNAIVFATQDTEMIVILVGDDPSKGVFFTGWLMKDGVLPAKWPMMVYRVDASGALQCSRAPNEEEEMSDTNTRLCLSVIASFYSVLATSGVTSYKPITKNSFINEKRKKKKKPLLYDWVTVVVEPPKPKSDYQGGTHASPRHHDRRGHFRTLRSGKKVWVRNHKVGNPANGTVFHDYQLGNV